MRWGRRFKGAKNLSFEYSKLIHEHVYRRKLRGILPRLCDVQLMVGRQNHFSQTQISMSSKKPAKFTGWDSESEFIAQV